MNKPIKKFKSGAIEAAIWENEKETDSGFLSFKTVSLSRAWKKKGENIWRHDQVNLRKNDLAKTILVLQKAQEELLMEQPMEDEENE